MNKLKLITLSASLILISPSFSSYASTKALIKATKAVIKPVEVFDGVGSNMCATGLVELADALKVAAPIILQASQETGLATTTLVFAKLEAYAGAVAILAGKMKGGVLVVWAAPGVQPVLFIGIGAYTSIKVYRWFNPTTGELLKMSREKVALLETEAYQKALEVAKTKGHAAVLKVRDEFRVPTIAKL